MGRHTTATAYMKGMSKASVGAETASALGDVIGGCTQYKEDVEDIASHHVAHCNVVLAAHGRDDGRGQFRGRGANGHNGQADDELAHTQRACDSQALPTRKRAPITMMMRPATRMVSRVKMPPRTSVPVSARFSSYSPAPPLRWSAAPAARRRVCRSQAAAPVCRPLPG